MPGPTPETVAGSGRGRGRIGVLRASWQGSLEKTGWPADTLTMMPPGRTPRTGAGRLSVAAALLGCALALAAPAFALAAVGAPSDGALSPRLAELAKPSVRAVGPVRQARLLSLSASGPGSLLRRGNRVVVEVRFDHGAAAGVEALRAAGAAVVNVSHRYETVTVAAKPAELRAVAAVPGVAGVKEVLTPMLFAAASCPSGATVSEGDSQLHAAQARGAFNLDGSGVTVGILSDSFNQASEAADGSGPVATHAREDEESGDLPGTRNPCGQTTPVDVLENDLPEPEKEAPADEGRGMAQVVHDLAPGANLAFASAFNGETAFAESIERLAMPVSEGGAGAQVIADDVAYFEEPFFQDGRVASAINRVTSEGVNYFTAAGNDNLFEEGTGHEIGSWEAPEFRNAGSCPSGVPAYAGTHCMDFDPETENSENSFGITVAPKATVVIDLQWAQPWFGVTTDLDAYLLKAGVRVAESQYPNTDSRLQEPVEVLAWENTSTEPAEVKLAINRCETACGIARASALAVTNPEFIGTTGGDSGTPRLKLILLENGGGVSKTTQPVSREGDTVGPTVFGHAGAASAIAVGAVRFNTTSEPEKYSSRGPVTHYFGPVTSASPAPKLPSPETLNKPDVAATDCGVTTFFAFEAGTGTWRFCGTSAAAPHAAAVAALMRQANPGLSPAQVRAGLASTARPVGSFGPDAVGGGLVDAFHAVGATALPPSIAIVERPAPLSRNRNPIIGFTANRPVSFACSLDGAAFAPCASTFTPSTPLADGTHSFAVSGTDAAGLVGTSEAVTFKIDTTPPQTFIRKHPRKLIRTRRPKVRAAFLFGASEEGVAFVCRVDRAPWRACGGRLVRRFKVGRHIVRVKATDAAGNTDPAPAVFRFRVEHVG